MGKFLVTGGAGFIGSEICISLIKANHQVLAFDDLSSGNLENLREIINDPNFLFQEGDVRNYDEVLRAVSGQDYVIHEAALVSVPRSIEEPVLNNEINVQGFLNVLEAARVSNVKRVVFASSSAVYGDNPDAVKTEERLGNVISPYALSKRADEMYASLYTRIYHLETVGLRYFNVYGEKQDPSSVYSGVISIFFDRVMKNAPITIYGDGGATRDFIYVSDVAAANLQACLSPNVHPGEAYNVGTGIPTTIQQLAAAVQKVSQNRLAISFQPARPGDIRNSCAKTDKAKKHFGFQKKIDLEDGLKSIYANLSKQKA
ncbi:MAG TPA: LPS biosynthesis protein WbpP [Acholeplasmatales bacterium]|nr:LPS biosynthesis protein WbpP [Acholeplasmatales bacterium]